MNKIFTLLIGLFLVGCVNAQNSKTAEIFFYNEQANAVTAEIVTVDVSNGDILSAVCSKLLEGPSSAEFRRVIPSGTKLLSIDKNQDLVTVDFSSEYNNATGTDRLWSRQSVVSTLCSIDGVQKVQILVAGEPIAAVNTGQPVGPLGKDDIVDDSAIATQQVKLYFGNDDGTGLTAENTSITLQDGQSIEKLVVNKLLSGPATKNAFRVIPTGVRLLTIDVREGVCFANFSQELISKHSGGAVTDSLIIYSIVNTLCDLPNVQKVQILIDGIKVNEFNHIDISEPLNADKKIIR